MTYIERVEGAYGSQYDVSLPNMSTISLSTDEMADLVRMVHEYGGVSEVIRLAKIGKDSESRMAVAVDLSESNRSADDISRWWMAQASQDAATVIPKAVEYSANDLVVIGRGLPGVPEGTGAAAEAGVAFYALGKAARLTGALGEGRLPSLDTWDDLAIYSMMGRYIRQHGRWGL